jgi:arylsulfatase A-like enzyme
MRRSGRPPIALGIAAIAAIAVIAGIAALAGGFVACDRRQAAPGAPEPALAPAGAEPEQAGFDPAPTRGYILISIDALRADHLGAYGYPRPTSPFLDELASRSTLFERAYAQVPSTLPSHISMFTGLYPAEHGVYPPSSVLAAEIRTLPEVLLQAGFRTSGHSEGGYVQGGYGFDRGFGEWTDSAYTSDTDVERTFGRGVDFLNSVRPGERFFLFLHTYSVHDPYSPPARYRELFWSGPPPAGAGEPDGPHFAAINAGREKTTPEAVAYFEALYDGSIRYLDDVLRGFFAELEKSGLARETTVIFTSDHGEEFLEHGRLAHTQIYPEGLHIPLIVAHPGQSRGARVGRLVQTVDFAPTIYDLSGVAPPPQLSGVSLVPLLARPDRALSGEAFGEVKSLDIEERTLLAARQGRLVQAMTEDAVTESDGLWVSSAIEFDALPPAVEFRAVAFHRPHPVRALVDGRPGASFDLATDWKSYRLVLPGGRRKHVVRLESDECHSPAALGLGDDGRCLSFKLYGPALQRRELFDLTADPRAAHDLSMTESDLLRDLMGRLKTGYAHQLRNAPAAQALSDEQIRELKALGYLN